LTNNECAVKENYMTTFRFKCGHYCITYSKHASMQKNHGHKCGKHSATNAIITCTVHTLEITCNPQPCNKFEFTFQLMIVEHNWWLLVC